MKSVTLDSRYVPNASSADRTMVSVGIVPWNSSVRRRTASWIRFETGSSDCIGRSSPASDVAPAIGADPFRHRAFRSRPEVSLESRRPARIAQCRTTRSSYGEPEL